MTQLPSPVLYSEAIVLAAPNLGDNSQAPPHLS